MGVKYYKIALTHLCCCAISVQKQKQLASNCVRLYYEQVVNDLIVTLHSPKILNRAIIFQPPPPPPHTNPNSHSHPSCLRFRLQHPSQRVTTFRKRGAGQRNRPGTALSRPGYR